jgi:hypothetical protein
MYSLIFPYITIKQIKKDANSNNNPSKIAIEHIVKLSVHKSVYEKFDANVEMFMSGEGTGFWKLVIFDKSVYEKFDVNVEMFMSGEDTGFWKLVISDKLVYEQFDANVEMFMFGEDIGFWKLVISDHRFKLLSSSAM